MMTLSKDDWSTVNEQKFYALSSLLRLRNGGQLEEHATADDEWTNFSWLSSKTDDMDSVHALAGNSDYDKELKERFLDRTAELISDSRGGSKVTATMLAEMPDVTHLFVAQNAALHEPALEFLKALELFIRDISRTNDFATDNRVSLFVPEVVRFQKPRIKILLKQLRDTPESIELLEKSGDTKQNVENTSDMQKSLDDLYRVVTMSDIDEVDRHVICVQLSYRISQMQQPEDVDEEKTWSCLSSSAQSSILYLACTQVAINVIQRAARKLPICGNLHIIVVENSKSKPRRRSKRANDRSKLVLQLRETLQLVGLQYDNQTMRKYFGKKTSLQSATKNFNGFQNEPKSIHAEIRLVMELNERQLLASPTVFDYIGCSRRSCYLCGCAVDFYKFRTRGFHKRLYQRWALPSCPGTDDTETFKDCILSVQTSMLRTLMDAEHNPLKYSKESTIGSTSLASMNVLNFDKFASIQAYERHMHRERIMGELPPRGTSEIQIYASFLQESEEPFPVSEDHTGQSITENECGFCERQTSRRCSRCHSGWFCGEYCERRSGLIHKFSCTGQQITTADLLYLSILSEEIPKDDDVRKDFGFTHCSHPMDESYLFGLYTGLHLMDIQSDDVHAWREGGTLTTLIIETYGSLREDARGGYFPWFLKNQYLLETVPDQDSENRLSITLEPVWHLLTPSDQELQLHELQPLPKRCGVFVMAIHFQHLHFPPSAQCEGVNFWYELGFVTCASFQEMRLGGLYNNLLFGNKFRESFEQGLDSIVSRPRVKTCPFAAFWIAWERGKLVQCFQNYGLGDELKSYSGLEHFLNYPLGSKRPEVYGLMRYLRSEDNNSPESKMAARCFGFSDEINAKERILLEQMYRSLLTMGSVLALQDALTRADVLMYAQRILKDVEEDLRPILQRACVLAD